MTIKIKKGAHLPTILSFDSSLGLAHVERGVIHPEGREAERSVNRFVFCCFFMSDSLTRVCQKRHSPQEICMLHELSVL